MCTSKMDGKAGVKRFDRFAWDPKRRTAPGIVETNCAPEKPARKQWVVTCVSVIQSVLTILAILIAAWWFVEQGRGLAGATLGLTANHVRLDKKWTLVEGYLTIKNIGARPIALKNVRAQILKITPPPANIESALSDVRHASIPTTPGGQEVRWPRIGGVISSKSPISLAVGERQILVFDFVVPSYVTTVRIQAEAQEDTSKRSFFWDSWRDALFWRADLFYLIDAKGGG